jgi:hypothetical protein
MKQTINFLSCIQKEDKSYSFLNKILQTEQNIPNKSMQPKKILKLHKKYFSFKSCKDFETRVKDLKNLKVQENPSMKAGNKETEMIDEYNDATNSLLEFTTGNKLNDSTDFMNFNKRKSSAIKIATYNKMRLKRGANSSSDLLHVTQGFTNNLENDRINSTFQAGKIKTQKLQCEYDEEFNQQQDVDNKKESLNIKKSRKIKENEDNYSKIKSEEDLEESMNLFKRNKNKCKKKKKEENKNSEFKLEVNPKIRKENPKKLNYMNKRVLESKVKGGGQKILEKLREFCEKKECSSEIKKERMIKNREGAEESFIDKPNFKRNSHQMLSNFMRRICIPNEVSLNKTTCENTEKNHINLSRNIMKYNNSFSNCDSDEEYHEQKSNNQNVGCKSYFEYKLPTIVSHVPTEKSCELKFPSVEFPNTEMITKKKIPSNKLLTDYDYKTTSFNQENERTNIGNNNQNKYSIMRLRKSKDKLNVSNLYIEKQENFSFVPFENKTNKKILNLKINSDLKIKELDKEKEKEFPKFSYVKSSNLNASSDHILQKNIQPEIRNPKLKYDKIEKLFGYLDSSNFASNLEKFNIENQKHYKEEKKTKKKNFFNFCFC